MTLTANNMASITGLIYITYGRIYSNKRVGIQQKAQQATAFTFVFFLDFWITFLSQCLGGFVSAGTSSSLMTGSLLMGFDADVSLVDGMRTKTGGLDTSLTLGVFMPLFPSWMLPVLVFL